jgi:precorrin-6B methylase 2
MSALKRWLKSFLPAGRHPRRPVTGLFRDLRLHLDLASETLIWLGVYERETYPHIRRFAAQSGSCIDIGAGKGELVCWWLREYPAKPVIAVEPNLGEVEVLQQNVAANVHTAASTLVIWPGYAGPGPTDRHRELASLCAALPDPIFIKLDIDGGEAALLENATDFLRSRSTRLLIEVHSVALEEACIARLQQCNYQVEIINPAPWRRWLKEHRPIAHNRWLVAEPRRST